MKKSIFTFFFALLIIGANAQITKPKDGDVFFEFKVSGINAIQADLNDTYGGAMLRVFSSSTRAMRYSADLGLELGDNTEVSFLTINMGREFHYDGAEKMSTYIGADWGIGAENDFDNIYLRGGLFTGFDYFISDGLYLGAEAGFSLYVDFDPFTFQFPGVNVNTGFKLGYRF